MATSPSWLAVSLLEWSSAWSGGISDFGLKFSQSILQTRKTMPLLPTNIHTLGSFSHRVFVLVTAGIVFSRWACVCTGILINHNLFLHSNRPENAYLLLLAKFLSAEWDSFRHSHSQFALEFLGLLAFSTRTTDRKSARRRVLCPFDHLLDPS